jgi:alkylated DNA repair protein (DNA oxidative demethylase)
VATRPTSLVRRTANRRNALKQVALDLFVVKIRVDTTSLDPSAEDGQIESDNCSTLCDERYRYVDSIERVEIAPGAWILRDFVTRHAESLLMTIQLISDKSPFRSVVTPTGKSMSVEMTNCGDYGWVSDRRGYRYVEIDPVTGTPWPAMPHTLVDLAALAASEAGYWGFRPDVCLINRYVPGSSMGMHQDRDERDFLQPIVSVSLGLSIRFRMSGTRRGGKTASTMLHHGDVVVFGGPARLAFHGVAKLRSGFHPLTGATRINLTFRSAL